MFHSPSSAFAIALTLYGWLLTIQSVSYTAWHGQCGLFYCCSPSKGGVCKTIESSASVDFQRVARAVAAFLILCAIMLPVAFVLSLISGYGKWKTIMAPVTAGLQLFCALLLWIAVFVFSGSHVPIDSTGMEHLTGAAVCTLAAGAFASFCWFSHIRPGERRHLRSADLDNVNWADCVCSCLWPQQAPQPSASSSTVVTSPVHARRARTSVGDIPSGTSSGHDGDNTPGCLKCLNGRRNVQASTAQQTVVNPLYPSGAVGSPQVAAPPPQPYPQPVPFQRQPFPPPQPKASPDSTQNGGTEVKDTVNPMWGVTVPGQIPTTASDPSPATEH